jgi:hypothetical protein
MRLSALGVEGVKRPAVPGDHGVEPPLPPEGRETRTAQRPGALPDVSLAKRNPGRAPPLPTVSRYLSGVQCAAETQPSAAEKAHKVLDAARGSSMQVSTEALGG